MPRAAVQSGSNRESDGSPAPGTHSASAPLEPGLRKLKWSRRWLSARGRSLEITKAGFVFIGLSLAVGFAAINSGSNLLHVIFGVQLGVIVASGLLSERMVTRAKVRRGLTSPLFAGAPGAVKVDLRNPSERGVLYSVSIEDDERYQAMGSMAPVFSLAVAPLDEHSQYTTVTLPRRGRHRLPPAVVATRFPFGLFVKRKQLDEAAEVLVFPRISPTSGSGAGSQVEGEGEATGRLARNGEFYGLDEFRDGHDVRRVHWPATARRGKLVVVEHEGDGDRTRFLDLASGRAGDPSFESEVERVASLAVAALREGGVAVGLRIDDEVVVAPASGAAQERRLLEVLATLGFDDVREGSSLSGKERGATP